MNKASYLAASVVAVALPAGPTAASEPVVFYNNHTNMCLQPMKGWTAPGTAIVLEPCNPGVNAAQRWLQIPVGGGSHYQNALTRLCLDARGKAVDKTPVQQWTCNKISNEIWEPLAYPSGPFAPKGPGVQLVSRVSGSSSHCLDIPGGAATAGLKMQIYACNGTISQEWEIEVVGSCISNPINAGCDQAPPEASKNGKD